ncbi:MAG: PepSY domain-containing protein [Gammaproteobacteria bacterium]|jgi:hypothetical protein|nr:PepSY domain-containing protein [Gammaproteobacteria bacterium]MBU1488269.1 PepSY domain-containing protein [Gammaproteobacteria bacterium]MBU2064931.1 PepSY domain-containing protein [Gammaproteobacteria bacterium]MBU2139552.1 PepSY domain-containing protein [Gammaproteobacteria bacterium]MBU2216544.1 PepSY domain-containing protein [Gammaproteobacteria bacterium]
MLDLRLTLSSSVLALSLGLLALPAQADVDCPASARASWMPESSFREHLKRQGVQITKFRITPGNCYEIYGFDAQGQRLEVYYDPVTATPVAEVPGALRAAQTP